MRTFTMLTDTPARLRNFLVARGVVAIVPDDHGGQTVVGIRPGMEIVEISNPIQIDPGSGVPGEPGYVPPIHDTRRAFMVKYAHESEDEKADNFQQWVLNNSTVVTAPPNYMINGEPVGDARKVNGENVWLLHDRPERFGVWQ